MSTTEAPPPAGGREGRRGARHNVSGVVIEPRWGRKHTGREAGNEESLKRLFINKTFSDWETAGTKTPFRLRGAGLPKRYAWVYGGYEGGLTCEMFAQR